VFQHRSTDLTLGSTDGFSGGPQLNGIGHNSQPISITAPSTGASAVAIEAAAPGHNWRPDEIDALHDSGKAATEPRRSRMVPKARFDELVKDSLRGGIRLAQRDTLCRAVVDQRLQPHHEMLLVTLVLESDGTDGTTYAGAKYLSRKTGIDEKSIPVLLSDLGRFGYVFTAKFAREPGGPAIANNALRRPSIEEIMAFVAAAGLGKKADKEQDRLQDSLAAKAAAELKDRPDSQADIKCSGLKTGQADQPPTLRTELNDSSNPTGLTLSADLKDREADFKKSRAVFKLQTAQPIEIPQCDRHNLLLEEYKKDIYGADAPTAPSNGDLFDDDATQGAGSVASSAGNGRAPTEPIASGKGEQVPPAARGRRAKPRTPILPDWTPTAELVAWVKSKWAASDHQIAEQAEQFLNYWQGKGETKADWSATWRTWWGNGFHKIPRRTAANDAAGAKSADTGSRLDPDTMSDSGWTYFVKSHRAGTVSWPDRLGPPPDAKGCRAPPEILRRHGYITGASQ